MIAQDGSVGTVDFETSQTEGCPVRKHEPQAKGEWEARCSAACDPGQSSPLDEGSIVIAQYGSIGTIDFKAG